MASRSKTTKKTKPASFTRADVEQIVRGVVIALSAVAATVEPVEPAPPAAATRQPSQTPPQPWGDQNLDYGGEWGSRHRF